MNLRRCPACRNMVAYEAECPICGIGYGAAIARRIIRWTLLAVLLGLLVWRFIPRADNRNAPDAAQQPIKG
jgi:hypothetical protein